LTLRILESNTATFEKEFERMKIACIGTGWYPQARGGLEKYVFGMTHALLSAGDSVDLFVTGTPQLDIERGCAYSIGDPESPLWKRMLDAKRSFARSLRGGYDVINVHFAMNALPLIPFIKHDIPRVFTFHGPWGAESLAEGGSRRSVAVKESLERFVYQRCDSFIVLSTAFKEILVTYGISRDRIHVITMGIECDFFKPALDRLTVRRKFGWPEDKIVFFTARRLVNRVGIHELIQSANILRESHSNFAVKVAGKGLLYGELQSEIARLDLTAYVELLGFVSEDELVRAYQAADITILPTQSLEGFGTIISESLACGTPVIVTPIGGMPEIVAPLGTDLIAKSASPADIAERMRAALDGTLKLPSADTCRAYAVEHFSWSSVVQQIRTVFHSTKISANSKASRV
jgi:glycosyltransferase involved in cell wall biosynthesis